MSAQTAVVVGLGVVFFGLAWISFKLNDSESDFNQYMGVLFLALAIAVLQMIGIGTMEIAANNSMTYLSNNYTTPLMWILNSVLFLFWFGLLFKVLIYMVVTIYDTLRKIFGGEL